MIILPPTSHGISVASKERIAKDSISWIVYSQDKHREDKELARYMNKEIMLREVETYTLQGAAIRPRRPYGPWHLANDNPCVTRELAITRYRLIWGKCGIVYRGYLVTAQNRKGFSPPTPTDHA